MDNRDRNADQWVSEKMECLQANGTWQPNAARALARLKARRVERAARAGRPWIWAVSGVALVALAIIALPSRGTCAQSVLGFGCATPAVASQVSPPAAVVVPAPIPAATVKAPVLKPVPLSVPAPLRNYKESGSPDAPLTCEIYSDYECPWCANFYEQTLPLLVEKYVKTGRMKLVHRDFPLPMHPYARLAARYANAAGELGYYDVVSAQLFRTQAVWAASGRIDDQVAQVVPAEAMKRLKDLLDIDKTLDETLAADAAMATRDAVDQTPTLVFVYRGQREKVAPIGSFPVLQSYVDQLPVK